MNIDTNNSGESTTTEITNNGDLEIPTLKKAVVSKKTVSKKKASPSPTDITFKEYVKRGKKILISLQKQKPSFEGFIHILFFLSLLLYFILFVFELFHIGNLETTMTSVHSIICNKN